jgi:hypothetical protein
VSLSSPSKHISILASGVLAAGLAVAVSPAANAEDVEVSLDATYTCTSSQLGSGDFSGTLTFTMPTSVPSASIVPSRPVHIKVVIPSESIPARPPLLNSIGGTATGLSYRVGSQVVPAADATIPQTPVPASGDMTIEADTTASSFQAQEPGTYAIKGPLAFTVNATAVVFGGGTQSDTVQCTYKSGEQASLEVTPIAKIASTTSANVLNKPITTAKRARVLVKVTAAGTVPTGTVKAKLGRKLLKTGTLSGGKVTLRLPKLPAGDKKVKFLYSGSLTVKPSVKAIVIRVKRA